MTAKQTESNQTLRQRAEEELNSGAATTPKVLSLDEANLLLHELRVHQIELEMQNEELRRTQVELDAARARYFDLYDLAPVGYCTLSEQGLILEANLTAATLLGVARSTLVKQPLSRFILSEYQDLYYRHRKQVFEAHRASCGQAGAPQSCELRMVKKDGTPFWAWLEATARQDADGAPVCRIVLSDITERRRAEETPGKSEKQYRLLFDEMLSGFAVHEIICDQSGTPTDYRFLSANKAFEKMTGLDASDIRGKTVLKVLPGTESSWIERYGKVALTGEPTQFENYSAVLGKHYEVRAYCPEHGKFATLVNDITERKQAEEEIKKQLDELLRWHNATLGRESRILDLKREVNELLGKAGDPPRYPSAESQDKKEE